MKTIGMTHSDLVNIGYKWVMKRCGFAFKELKCVNNEIPDVVGFNSSGTFLLEAKVSRSDFLADKKKNFRQFSEMGIGDWRFFIVPKGLIRVDELPEMWGLIEVTEKGKPICTHNPFGKGNFYSLWKRNTKSIDSEFNMMYSALRRIELRKLMNVIYEPLK